LNGALLVAAVVSLIIAAMNGSNDVSKSVATLAGGGVAGYRRAILWGAVWTTVGSIASFGFAKAMVNTFGKGLLGSGIHPTFQAAIATILGAALWVGIATRVSLPVSTTHAIVGSLAGGRIRLRGRRNALELLASKVALPLLLSPFASLILTRLALIAWKSLSPQSQVDCLCTEVHARPASFATATGPHLGVTSFPDIHVSVCRQRSGTTEDSTTFSLTVDGLHWLTSAATSLARGLNDAPKMVALLISASALSGHVPSGSLWAFLLIATGILAGSIFAGRRVTTVLGEGITSMDHREGFVANLITAALVGPGAALGLPMSTTHVASGAIVGIGTGRTEMNWMLREIALAWVVTIPTAALFGIVAFELLRLVHIG
jgi:PiT family inorganic phosphate transporter